MSLADTEQFGILRLIVKDWEKAVSVFEQNGSVVKVTDVVAIQVANKPGSLADVLAILDEAKLNIEYVYEIRSNDPNLSNLLFRFDDTENAIQALQQSSVKIVGANDIF